MKALHEFIKSTFIGGLLVVLPLGLVAMVAAKGVAVIEQVLTPIVEHLPSGLHFPTSIAVALLISVCLVAGLLTQTRAGQNAGRFFQRTVLNHIPGYTLIRSVVRSIGNADEHGQFASAFVELDGARAPAIVVKAHADDTPYLFLLRQRLAPAPSTSCPESEYISSMPRY